MDSGSHVDGSGFTNYSHLNPIDPAQYQSETPVSSQESARRRSEDAPKAPPPPAAVPTPEAVRLPESGAIRTILPTRK